MAHKTLPEAVPASTLHFQLHLLPLMRTSLGEIPAIPQTYHPLQLLHCVPPGPSGSEWFLPAHSHPQLPGPLQLTLPDSDPALLLKGKSSLWSQAPLSEPSVFQALVPTAVKHLFPPKTEIIEGSERNPLMSEVSPSNTMPGILIYIWWMYKWVNITPTKFGSNIAKLLVIDYVWMRGAELSLEGVMENITRPLRLQFPSAEYRSCGVLVCSHVTDWLFYSLRKLVLCGFIASDL